MHFSSLAWFVGTKIQAHRRTFLSLLGFLKMLFSCSVNPYLAFLLSPTGAGRYHRGPPSGCDPPVSGVLPSLLLPSSLPHTSPAAIPASPSLHPQLSLFLSSRQPWGAASPSVLPTPPSPHVRRSRYSCWLNTGHLQKQKRKQKKKNQIRFWHWVKIQLRICVTQSARYEI